MKPKEGTILTVAKSASLKARELADAGETDLEKYIGDIIERADYVLSQTPEMPLKTGWRCGFRRTGSDAGIKGRL